MGPGSTTRQTSARTSRDELAIRTLVVTLRDALRDISDGRYSAAERRDLMAGMIAWVRERLRQHASAAARDGAAARLAEGEQLVDELQRGLDEEVRAGRPG
ncbi:MAG: hypothetical protein ABR509_06690 [Candidatus Limnocylindria bacterium]